MKKVALSLVALVAMNSWVFAGGDFATIEPVVVGESDDNNFYAGLGGVYNRVYSIDSGWFDDSISTQDQTAGLTGVIGYNYNEYIGVEGRISGTFFERDYSDTTAYSIFLRPQYRFQEDDINHNDYDEGYFTVYGLLGFGNVNVKGSSGDNSLSAWPNTIGQDILSTTSFQWGFGLSYTLVELDEGIRKNTWSLFMDYTVLANDADIYSRLYDYDSVYYDKLSVDALTVGLTYTF